MEIGATRLWKLWKNLWNNDRQQNREMSCLILVEWKGNMQDNLCRTTSTIVLSKRCTENVMLQRKQQFSHFPMEQTNMFIKQKPTHDIKSIGIANITLW